MEKSKAIEIGKRVQEVRKKFKMPRHEFSKRLGVSESEIFNVEKSRLKRPDQKETLYKVICNEFNVSQEWLIDGIGKMMVEKSRDEEIIDAVTKAVGADSDSVRYKFAMALVKLSEDDWKAIEAFGKKLLSEEKNE